MCLCVGMSAAVNAVSDSILQGRAAAHSPCNNGTHLVGMVCDTPHWDGTWQDGSHSVYN